MCSNNTARSGGGGVRWGAAREEVVREARRTCAVNKAARSGGGGVEAGCGRGAGREGLARSLQWHGTIRASTCQWGTGLSGTRGGGQHVEAGAQSTAGACDLFHLSCETQIPLPRPSRSLHPWPSTPSNAAPCPPAPPHRGSPSCPVPWPLPKAVTHTRSTFITTPYPGPLPPTPPTSPA